MFFILKKHSQDIKYKRVGNLFRIRGRKGTWEIQREQLLKIPLEMFCLVSNFQFNCAKVYFATSMLMRQETSYHD